MGIFAPMHKASYQLEVLRPLERRILRGFIRGDDVIALSSVSAVPRTLCYRHTLLTAAVTLKYGEQIVDKACTLRLRLYRNLAGCE